MTGAVIGVEAHGGSLRSIGVHGIGPVCALGSGVDAFRKGLRGSISPSICVEPPPPEWDLVQGEPAADSAIFYTPVAEGLDRFVSPRTTRRLDAFSKQAVLAAFLAVEDARIEFSDMSRVGVVIGTGNGPLVTTFSFLDGIIVEGDPAASPTLFANSVHNAPASQISIRLKTTGPCSTVTAFRDTVRGVLELATSWIAGGIVDYCVAGFGDEYCPVSGYALHRMRNLRAEGDRMSHLPADADAEAPYPVHPFDFTRDTYVPGGGFTAFLLGGERGRYGSLSVLPEGNAKTNLTSGTLLNPLDLASDAGLMIVSADGGTRAAVAFGGRLPIDEDTRSDRSAGMRSGSDTGCCIMLNTGIPCVSYVPLYGGFMTGGALDLTAAAVCVHDRVIYRPASPTENDPESLGDRPVVCIEHGENGTYGVYVLR